MHEPAGRRDFLKLSALALAGGLPATAQNFAVKPGRDPFRGLKFGLTTYSTRRLTLDQTLDALRSMGIGHLTLKDVHLSMTSTAGERAAVRKKVEAAGLKILSCGVITWTEEAQIRPTLEYVRDVGAGAVVAVPAALLPAVNKLVKELDVRVGIHNHGPEDKNFPSALAVFDAIQPLDTRIGCVVDIGHTFRKGLDPAAVIRKCAPRLYEVHLKDVPSPQSRAAVPLGSGVVDVVAVLRTLLDIKYGNQAALEYEGEPENPIPGMAASYGFLRGALAAV